jgi:hypothetical protein
MIISDNNNLGLYCKGILIKLNFRLRISNSLMMAINKIKMKMRMRIMIKKYKIMKINTITIRLISPF